LVEVYIREPDGSLVARFEPGEDPVVQYYFDGLGSTVMLTEGLSAVSDRYDYDAWGNEYPIMASTVDNPYRYVGELGYYTHWMDPSLSDLLHLGVRFYEPGVGRFTQVDPAMEGWNWYRYVAQATFGVDPGGNRCTRLDLPREAVAMDYPVMLSGDPVVCS
jgi:RHS repeat-associated protein